MDRPASPTQPPSYRPEDCPYCEYDRQFPETGGGWIYLGNNGGFGPCPVCNPNGTYPRSSPNDE